MNYVRLRIYKVNQYMNYERLLDREDLENVMI